MITKLVPQYVLSRVTAHFFKERTSTDIKRSSFLVGRDYRFCIIFLPYLFVYKITGAEDGKQGSAWLVAQGLRSIPLWAFKAAAYKPKTEYSLKPNIVSSPLLPQTKRPISMGNLESIPVFPFFSLSNQAEARPKGLWLSV